MGRGESEHAQRNVIVHDDGGVAVEGDTKKIVRKRDTLTSAAKRLMSTDVKLPFCANWINGCHIPVNVASR